MFDITVATHDVSATVTIQEQGLSTTARRMPVVSCKSEQWNPTCHAHRPLFGPGDGYLSGTKSTRG